MIKVLVIGGGGFIGFHTSNFLISNGFEVDIIDNFSRGTKDKSILKLAKSKQLNIIDSDISDINLDNISKEYDYIYHFAAIVGVDNVLSRPYDVLVKNFILLEKAIEIGQIQKDLKRFLFTSTSEVYAQTLKNFGLEFPTPESTPLTVGSPFEKRTTYLLSKIYGEAMCNFSDIPFTIFRPHNFYGPRMGNSHVIPQLINKIYQASDKIDIYTPLHTRTFCYIDDAIQIMTRLAELNSTNKGYFNIGNEKNEISMLDLANIIMKIMNKKLEINILTESNSSPERRCPSMEKTNAHIEYEMAISLKKGVENCYKWYLENEI